MEAREALFRFRVNQIWSSGKKAEAEKLEKCKELVKACRFPFLRKKLFPEDMLQQVLQRLEKEEGKEKQLFLRSEGNFASLGEMVSFV